MQINNAITFQHYTGSWFSFQGHFSQRNKVIISSQDFLQMWQLDRNIRSCLRCEYQVDGWAYSLVKWFVLRQSCLEFDACLSKTEKYYFSKTFEVVRKAMQCSMPSPHILRDKQGKRKKEFVAYYPPIIFI